jgi:hypothetical protein
LSLLGGFLLSAPVDDASEAGAGVSLVPKLTKPHHHPDNRLPLWRRNVHWDGTGLWVHAKRLERGTCRWPRPSDAKNGKLSLEPAALAMLTDGIDLRDGMRRAWFERD